MKNLRSTLAVAAVMAAAMLASGANGTQVLSSSGGSGQQGSSKVADWTRIAETAPERAEDLADAQKSFARCRDGLAADTYPCDNIDMLSFVDIGTLGVTFINDMWGWRDPVTRREYVLLGSNDGTFAIDVTRPRHPEVIGMLPTASSQGGFFWRDIKVFDNHAFIVSEHDNHGLQVWDLTTIRGADTSAGPVTFTQAAQYAGFSSAHNIAINEDTGFAYVVGADICSGGLLMIDIGVPASPSFAGCFDSFGYVHDTQCVIYHGPDLDHIGKEICFNATPNQFGDTDNSVSITDVTDKLNPVGLGIQPYGVSSDFSHQGWLTEDQTYFVHGDELDEFFGSVASTTTRIWNVEDLDNPRLVAEVTYGTTSVDHNIYIRGDLSYASNYTSGLRVFDVDDIEEGVYEQVAFFDMYPEDDDPDFAGGTWSNFPFFRREGVVAVSSMDRGLFMLRVRDDDDDDDDDDGDEDDDD